MIYRETSTTRDVTATLMPPAEACDWRARLRSSTYSLYRQLVEHPRLPLDAEVEELVGLIDEGRAEPASPPTLTRITAEALGGAISRKLWFAALRDQPSSESELVPMLMYMAVLPYMGPDCAAEELRAPPPPR
jgi:hypothetical protein